MKSLLLLTFVLLFITICFNATAQTYPPRLCNGTWKLKQLQSVSGLQEQPPAVEFRLILSPDGRMQQGLYPEGMVQSNWNLDPIRMLLHVHDTTYNNAYTLRVVSLRNDALVLETNDLGERMLMYYTLMH